MCDHFVRRLVAALVGGQDGHVTAADAGVSVAHLGEQLT